MKNSIKLSKDGFGYDLDKAFKEGNIFEKVFHGSRVNFWLNNINYKKKKVLDVGCNTGILLIPLLQKKIDVVGIDVSGKDILLAKEKLEKNGFSPKRAIEASIYEIPFSNSSFEMIILSDVLEHVVKPNLASKEVLRVAKKGGLIYVTVPNEMHPVVKFFWLRKLLSGRKNIDEHPDVPYNFSKLIKLFPETKLVRKGFLGFGTEILCVFKKI